MMMKMVDGTMRFIYRVSGGRLISRMAGLNVLILTTTGRKSGQPRAHTLGYMRDGENIVVVASKGGAPQHPDWYFNLTANPQVSVNIKGKDYKMTARTATTEGRARLWPMVVKNSPGYAKYQEVTQGIREIPLVILERM
ncbi:MAG: nitroreductase family deazaflavin-dependent oxidoreductase [Candidatus Chloroheliales bacterium]|nr:MAG: nitroreductase family deazaflavin-dependent oxidoreductase [Chloroflexota bacterium]